jgi:hypothetical protein
MTDYVPARAPGSPPEIGQSTRFDHSPVAGDRQRATPKVKSSGGSARRPLGRPRPCAVGVPLVKDIEQTMAAQGVTVTGPGQVTRRAVMEATQLLCRSCCATGKTTTRSRALPKMLR